MSFENDIYISLVSGTNENSWEKNLIRFLCTLLKRFLSRSVKTVFLDDFNTEEQRQHAINNSAAFLIIITEDYIKSNISSKELDLIHESIHGNFNRIFKVLKTDINAERQPSTIKNLMSYNFFEKQSDQDELQTYYESKIFDIERNYWTKLTDMAFDVYKIIESEKILKGVPYIFIAETTDEQNNNRESITRELKRLGYLIYPDKMLSKNPALLKIEVEEYLQKSFIAIHLIGNNYGELLENSEYSLIEMQNKIASDYFEILQQNSDEFASKIFSRLIWLDPDMKISNEKQNLFVERLKRDADLLKGASMIQTPLENFKSIVIAEINHKKSQILNSFNKLSLGIKVYLIHESQSFEKISTISAQLVRSGFEIIHSPLLNEERNLLKKHRQNLTDCDAVLIFYDSNDVFWLKSKINDLMKAPGYGRKRSFTAKAVLLDCENILPKDFLESKDFIVIENPCDSSSYSLDKFIDKIQMSVK